MSLALGFEIQQFAGNALIVDLVATISNGLLQLVNAFFVYARQVTQLVGDLLQLLGILAQLHGLAGTRSLVGIVRLRLV